MATMKEVFIFPDLQTSIDDAPIPVHGEYDVLVRIVVSGANPIDWKAADERVAKIIHGNLKAPLHRNSGKDFAGYVHGKSIPLEHLIRADSRPAVGAKILNFKVGDRVISLNHSSGFAEYGLGPAHTTAHIPDNVTFEGMYPVPIRDSSTDNLQRQQRLDWRTPRQR
jgi:NADPH2:quinone reductase